MCLPDVELATTDAENASVFGPHFDIVFNNHRPIEWTVLYNIKQIYVMEELYPPNSWYKIKKSTPKLENDKEPGLNDVLTNTFKALNNENLTWLLIFYNQI